MRPTSTAARKSSTQFCISAACRRSSAARNISRFSVSDASFIKLGSFERATTARKSRRSTVSIIFSTASTLSCHSATRKRGNISTTKLTKLSELIFGLPSFTNNAFCLLTAWRTAPMPPANAFSAKTRSSGLSASSTALR